MRRVGVLVTEHVRVFDYAVATEVWGLDRTHRGVPSFELRTCGPQGSAVPMQPGATCVPDHDLDGLDACDLVVVPGVQNPAGPVRPDVSAALRAAHARGATVASLCSGAFLLATAGLLDGRRATAHWQDADELARRHPGVTVDPNVLFIGDGAVWTSAGVAAGIDLCLHLVRRDHGAAVAAEIARTMVTAPFRPGGQAQFLTRPVPAPGRGADPLPELRARILGDLAHPWTLGELAGLARMSERTFSRRFVQATGATPLQWLLTQRVLAAQQLLEVSDLPIAAIARRCGFGSPLTLRHHFTRHVGLPPRDYRQSFGTGVGRPRAADS
ncbi:GlxA family transcriptional regulator [Actinomadura harenae]|uniref:Helix-turn-helix domain-containing protein n=1 Tax=Actinomadura harenae TaxID=2483351 RepID=A0A3M2MBZ2_9ACTN|nr:helix-turn-helix domain-containing protein [Actinomadura harenae]RMI47032.1 helix-turn-helix domain-containing protein [Actinomadura harenae]